jgi:hypothetical protein
MQEATMEFIAKQPKQRQELDTPAIGGKRQPVPAVLCSEQASICNWMLGAQESCGSIGGRRARPRKFRGRIKAYRPAISYSGNWRNLKVIRFTLSRLFLHNHRSTREYLPQS